MISSVSQLCMAATYVHELRQGVDDLVGPDVAEDVDDLAVAGLALRVDDIPQRKGLVGRGVELACCRAAGLGVHDDLEAEVSRRGLAVDVLEDGALDARRDAIVDAGEAREDNGLGRRAVPQACQAPRHVCAVCGRWWWWALRLPKDSR